MICYNKIYQHYISFDAGGNYVEIHLAVFPKFAFKRDKNAQYYRIKTTEWKFLRGWNAGIYDVLKAFIDDPDSVASQIKVKTVLNDSSGTPVRTYYEGLIKLARCEVDADTEAITFMPDADDDYAWYENVKSIKYNPQVIVPYDEFTIYTRTATKVRIFQYDDGGVVGVGEFNETCGAQPNAWAVGVWYIDSDIDINWVKYAGIAFRCILAHTSTATGATGPPPPAGNSYWLRATPYADYVRYESDIPFDGFVAGNGVYDIGYPTVTARVDAATNVDEGRFYKKVCTSTTETKTLATRARKLIDFTGAPDEGVFNQMLITAGQTFTVVSEFFNSANNPVTRIANRFLNLIISSKEMVINGYGSSNVNSGITFEDFFKMLRETFNCYWYIAGGNLIIEHLSYFEEGLTYGGLPSVGVDLTTATYPAKINNTKDSNGDNANNKYSFVDFEFPEREVWKFAEQLGNDGYVEYSSKIVEKEKEVSHSAQFITTDLEFVVKFPDQVDEKGWMILACDVLNEVLRADARKLGYIPGQGAPGTMYDDVINGDLYWDNLLPNFWRHGRSLTNIVINGTVSKALSLNRGKRQEKVKFQRMEDIAITDLIRTHMGAAEVDQMEVDTETDWITTSLLHDI